MATYREARSIAYPVELMFNLVADVESYPQFLPFWQEARIIRREQGVYYTEQAVGFGPLSDRFQTKTCLDSPRQIVVSQHRAEGMFKQFHIIWQFEQIAANASKVRLAFDVEPRSRLFRRLIDKVMREAAQGMLISFERRARSQGGFTHKSEDV